MSVGAAAAARALATIANPVSCRGGHGVASTASTRASGGALDSSAEMKAAIVGGAALGLDDDAFGVVEDETREAVPQGEPMDEGAKADPLDDAADAQADSLHRDRPGHALRLTHRGGPRKR